jgi:protocatechuate 3,4-dioxygenase beta subunit
VSGVQKALLGLIALILLVLLWPAPEKGGRGGRRTVEERPRSREEEPPEAPAADPPEEHERPPYGDRSLARHESIRGRVLDPGGEPVADAIVHAGHRDLTPGAFGYVAAARVRSEPDGSFVLGPLARRRYDVWAEGPDGRTAATARNKQPGNRIDLHLAEAARITGVVSAPDGAPVEGARVIAVDDTRLHEARTGPLGEYELAPLPATANFRIGVYVRVVAAGFVAAERTHLVLDTGERRLDFVLERGGVLVGLVRDAATGKPIARASVGEGWEPFHRRVETDANGAFKLGDVDIAPNEAFAAHAQGYLPASAQSDGSGRVEFALVRARSVAGLVVDPDGRPVAGARVYLRGFGPRYERRSRRSGRPSTMTGPDGRFRLDGIGYEEIALAAFARGWAPGEEGPIRLPAAEQARVQLRPGFSVAGVVRDRDGRPAPGIRVRLTRQYDPRGTPGYRWAPEIRTDEPVTFTDEKGKFRIGGALPGKHRVIAMGPSHGWVVADVEGQAGGEVDGIVLALGGGAIEGTFRDGRGRPVPDGRVSAFGPKDTQQARTRTIDLDGRGRFRIAGLAEGRYDVHGFSSLGRAGPLPDVPVGARDLRLVLPKTSRLRGEVVSAVDGRPVTKYTITFRLRGRAGWGGVLKTPDGSFDRPLAPGTYSVVVRADGHASRVVDGVRIEPGLDPEPLRVVLDPGGSIEGTVRGANGSPVAGAWVNAQPFREGGPQPDDWIFSGSDTADANGRFFIRGVGAGTYLLETNRGSQGLARVRIVVQPGETTRKDLALLPTGTILLTATDPDGRPVPSVAFGIRDLDGGWLGWAPRTDAKGQSTSSPLRKGDIVVHLDERQQGFAMEPVQARVEAGRQVGVSVVVQRKK